MKKGRKKLALIFILFALCLLCSCGKSSLTVSDEKTETASVREDIIKLSHDKVEGDYIHISSKYTIIYPKNDFEAFEAAAKLRNTIKEKTGLQLKIQGDSEPYQTIDGYKYEIIVGNTNRKGGGVPDKEGILIKVLKNSIFINVSGNSVQNAVDFFISKFVTYGGIKLDKTTHLELIYGAHKDISSLNTVKIAEIKYLPEKNEYKILCSLNTAKINLVGVSVEVLGNFAKNYNFASDILSYGTSGIYECEFTIRDIPKTLNNFLVFTLTPYALVNGNVQEGEVKTVVFCKNEIRKFENVKKLEGFYLINDISDLILISAEANRGKRFISAILQNDITIPESFELIPIGGENASYKGIFDGNGYKIKNLSVSENTLTKIGLFGVVGSGGEIKNLTVENAKIQADKATHAGIIAGENRGKIINCKVIDSEIISENCVNESNIGGIAGEVNGKYDASVESSSFDGKINIANDKTAFVGGIVGVSTATKAEVSFCTNYGEVGVIAGKKSSVGGVAGEVASGLIYACENRGNVEGKNSICGGIVGAVTAMARIVECANTPLGFLKSDLCAGGIVGAFTESTIGDGMILRSYNAGSVVSLGENSGGVVGQIKTSAFVYDSYNKGEVKGKINAGGICGYTNQKRTYIMNCFNVGTVYSAETQRANEIIGFTAPPFGESYMGQTGEDVFVNYKNNYYLAKFNSKGEKINRAYNGEKTDFACESVEAFKSRLIGSNSPFVESENSIYPILAFEADKSLHSSFVPPELYVVRSSTLNNDKSRYYLTARYIKYISDGKDNVFKITIEDFYSKYGIKSGKKHSIISKSGEVLSECSCAVFEGDHYIKTEVWKRILDSAETYIQASADLLNYGEIVPVKNGFMVDINTDAHAHCIKIKSGDRQYADKITLNPDYFNGTEDKGIIAHELAHATHANFGCEVWLKEGMADYVKYKIAGDVDNILQSRTKDFKFKEGYKDTAALLVFLENNFGEFAVRQIIRIMESLNSDFDTQIQIAFGVSFEGLYNHFQKAELVSDILPFCD